MRVWRGCLDDLIHDLQQRHNVSLLLLCAGLRVYNASPDREDDLEENLHREPMSVGE